MAVYLDHNATTPMDPRVVVQMTQFFADGFGNSSSRDHRWGWNAAEAVEEARGIVADACGVASRGVVFTSGASEALNTVLRGYAGFSDWERKTIVTCATEHDAVLSPARHVCGRTGVRLELLPVDSCGRLDLDLLETTLRQCPPGAMVALMLANNEVGTVHPIRAIAEIVHAADGQLLSDTAQAFGRIAVDAGSIDLLVLSAHKIHGPKGAGALLKGSNAFPLEPLVLGGGQEGGQRGGTLNTPGIVGLGEACRLIGMQLDDDMALMGRLRDRLEQAALSQVPGAWVNGDREHRLCNTTNIGFKGVDARALIRDMHDVAVSTRSACASGHSGPSHVLKAMGLSDEDAYSCIRFSLGRFTTEEDIDYAIAKLTASVRKLRRLKSGHV